MKRREYGIFKNTINGRLERFEKSDELNYNYGQVADRCLYELEPIMLQGYTESIISYATVGRYIMERCTDETKRYNRNELLEVLGNYDRNRLDEDITEEEIRELEEDICFVLDELKKLK